LKSRLAHQQIDSLADPYHQLAASKGTVINVSTIELFDVDFAR
jgi:hypothetical protein